LGAGIILVILAVIFISCSPTEASNSSGSNAPSTPVGQAIGVTIDSSNAVDISGWAGVTNGTITYGAPVYWQNTTLWPMAVSQGSYFSVYWGAVDSSNNFYVAGAVGSSSSTSTPVYWENGAMNNLNVGASYSYGVAYSVVVSGGYLYVVGAVGTSNSNLVPCYWVVPVGQTTSNLNLLQFNSATYSSGWALSVAFDISGKAYFAGAVANSQAGTLTPCYWVVTSPSASSSGQVGQSNTLLMSGTTNIYGSAYNIGVYGSAAPQTIYISGIEGTTSSANLPCFWTGLTTTGVTNAPTDLSLGGNTSFDLNWAALDTSGDFYLVGGVGSSSSMTPCYWEVTGGTPTPPTILPTGPGNSGGEAFGIAFDSSHVYIVGAVGQPLPCYWENNVLNILTTGNAQDLESAKNIGGKPNYPWWKKVGHQRF